MQDGAEQGNHDKARLPPSDQACAGGCHRRQTRPLTSSLLSILQKPVQQPAYHPLVAAVPDAESSGTVSPVLKTTQLVGCWCRLGGRSAEQGSPRGLGVTQRGSLGWVTRWEATLRDSEPPGRLISDGLSGQNIDQTTGLSPLSRTQFRGL